MKLLFKWLRGLRSGLGRGEYVLPAKPRRQASDCRHKLGLAFDSLEDRSVPAAGWAASMPRFNDGTGGWSVALDTANSAVYVAGDQVAKYTMDGTLLWSKSLGAVSPTLAYGIAVDPTGAAYATGRFTGALTLGSQTLTSAGDRDAFVAKFDSAGNVLWAKSYGALGSDGGYGIAADATGIYVAGQFSNTVAFDASHSLTSAGTDAFVLKLDPSGNVAYAAQTGGTGQAGMPRQLALDGNGQVYVTGTFGGTASFGLSNLTAVASRDIFIAQLNANGNFSWARQVAGGANNPRGIAVDGSGRLFTSGSFSGTTTFDYVQGETAATAMTAQGVNGDAYVMSLDAATGTFLWAKQLGAASSVQTSGNTLALDDAGDVYLAGDYFAAGIDSDPGPGKAILTIPTNFNYPNGFVAKVSPSGSFLGAWQMSSGYTHGVAVGADGSIYTTGQYLESGIFDTGAQYVTLTTSSFAGYVSRLIPSKSTLFGQAFNDLNRDGVQDVADAAFAGVTVYLDTNNNGVRNSGEPTTTTNVQGGFSFAHLNPGTYTVRVVIPSGNSATTASAFTVTVAAGQANTSAIFGIGRTPKTTSYSNTTAASTSATNPNAVSTLTIADSYFIQTFDITLKVTNGTLKPMTIKLTAPDGTAVTLATNVNKNGTLTYSTAAFNGKNVNGPWKLEVLSLAGGKLNSWSLSIFG